jgi:hypothetical protein
MVKIDGPFKPRLALIFFTSILFVQFASVVGAPKGVSWDPSYGLLAAQQHLVGMSPNIFTLAEAEPTQITQVSTQPVPYWAPAYQAVPYALRLGIFNWGVALKLTLGLVLIVGAIGWLAYFAEVLPSADLALWLSAVVALTRFRWTMVLTYDGGDQLIWGASPWALVIAAAALRSAQQGATVRAAGLSAAAGAIGASLFALKYSGVFVAIGAFVVFGIVCYVRRYWQMIFFAGVAFVTVIGAIIWAGFPQGVTASTHGEMNVLRAIASLGLPAIGVTDLDSLLRAIWPSTSPYGELAAPFIGASLSLVITVGLVAYVRLNSASLIRVDHVLASLAIGAVIGNCLILFLLILNGGNISLEGRFGRVSGLLLLPLLLTAWQAMLHAHRATWRAFAGLGMMMLLIVPAILATARQLPHLVDRFIASSAVDTDGIVNLSLTPGTDAQRFYAEIESISPNSVLYTIYPQMAFPLPQRNLILVEAEEQETPASLSAKRYYGRPPGGVALLLPVTFEYNGKLDAIRASFVGIHRFIRRELRADPKWALWVGLD